MPTATCKTCGRTTNSACSNYWFNDDGSDFHEVTECYLAWNPDTKKWEKGCAYDKCDKLHKGIYDKWMEDDG